MPSGMDGLLFAIAPALPNQSRRFTAGQPAAASLALWRQRHPNQSAMQPLLGVMVDGGTKGLEVASGASRTRSMFDISRTASRIDL